MSILDRIWRGTLSPGIDDSVVAWPLRMVMDTCHPAIVGTQFPLHRYLYSNCWAPTTTLVFITWFAILLLDIRNLWLISWFHDGSVDKAMWLENHWNDWFTKVGHVNLDHTKNDTRWATKVESCRTSRLGFKDTIFTSVSHDGGGWWDVAYTI